MKNKIKRNMTCEMSKMSPWFRLVTQDLTLVNLSDFSADFWQ